MVSFQMLLACFSPQSLLASSHTQLLSTKYKGSSNLFGCFIYSLVLITLLRYVLLMFRVQRVSLSKVAIAIISLWLIILVTSANFFQKSVLGFWMSLLATSLALYCRMQLFVSLLRLKIHVQKIAFLLCRRSLRYQITFLLSV